MARIMIWPDLYREQGHWMPCINLARSLQRAGHTPRFMGIPDCEVIVSTYHGQFTKVFGDIYPVGHSVEDNLEPKGQRWKPHHLLPLCRGALDSIFRAADAPQVLVSGYFNALESLLIHHKYGTPLVTITTYLRHPDDDPAMLAKTKLIYMSDEMVQALMLGSLGRVVTLEEFIRPLEVAPEIIPCTKELDYTDPDWVHGSNVHYVEPMVLREMLDGSTLPSDPQSIGQGRRVIFASSGSQVQDYEAKAKEMFRNLISMMRLPKMSDRLLVLAVGSKVLTELNMEYKVGATDTTLPKNVMLFDWVSQLDILGEADVVFTHGGLATIKESIWEGVPMVIVPHGKDQVDNALRLTRLGIAVEAPINRQSPQGLREMLTQVRSNAWLKKNLAVHRAQLRAQDLQTSKPSVYWIQQALASG